MKKLLFAFATAVLLVAMPKLRVSAQVTTEVIQGLTCTYDDETKTLTITGEGSLEGGTWFGNL